MEWALSVMAPGGLGIIPQSTSHQPDNLLPNRAVALWPYTDMADERIHWGIRYVTLRQDAHAGPTKVGLNVDDGWLAYLNQGMLFVKRFDYQPREVYPDGGCCVEMHTKQQMLEAETPGPLTTLDPADCATHVERWYLFALVSVAADSEEAIKRGIRALANSVQ